MSNEDLLSKLDKVTIKLENINIVLIEQHEKIKEQSKILEGLYNELHKKQKKIEDLEKGCK